MQYPVYQCKIAALQPARTHAASDSVVVTIAYEPDANDVEAGSVRNLTGLTKCQCPRDWTLTLAPWLAQPDGVRTAA